MRATIFPTEIAVTKDELDHTYTDVEIADEDGSTLVLHLTQVQLVALWKGLESPRMVGREDIEGVAV